MNVALPPPPALRPFPRKAVAGACVVALHVAALWALQAGLLQRVVEVVVPVTLTSEIVTPPAPKVETPPAPIVPPPPKPEPVKKVVVSKPTPPAPAPAPKLLAAPNAPAVPDAPSGATEPQPAPPPVAAPVAAAPAPAPAPAPPPRVELPTKDADYLRNPPPPYPPMSVRMGEEGTVVVRVVIAPDGHAIDAQVAKSSGFPRLDAAAVKAAREWMYKPGTRGGVPEQMAVNVPINFGRNK